MLFFSLLLICLLDNVFTFSICKYTKILQITKKNVTLQKLIHIVNCKNTLIMNIHIVQHDIVSNNPEENLKWILEELETPESKEALLTVFPACTLCGAPLYGSVAYTDVQKRAQAALQELVQRSEHRAYLVGMPLQIQDRARGCRPSSIKTSRWR